MRMSQAHSKAIPAVFIALLLSPQTVSPSSEKRLLDLRQEQPIAKHPPGFDPQTLILKGSRPEPRSPVETPPTEYLPYPPPPNYSWPPGPHTQYPPPSETNAPAGWYGGTGTGGQGNSGAGSASGSSAQTSAAVPSLRLPSLFHIPLDVLLLLLRPFLLPPSSSMTHPLRARTPVETPPSEYLPYPSPPNYQWPLGQSPRDQNPRAGWYGGSGLTVFSTAVVMSWFWYLRLRRKAGAGDGGEREGKEGGD
ncbi:MAG: hypothetical protein LQ350_000617 [Teloschistes chrysophthalmus]|nr:MAG: hypothetical protein LQ350_000617 [Niorma chrysophthalma]